MSRVGFLDFLSACLDHRLSTSQRSSWLSELNTEAGQYVATVYGDTCRTKSSGVIRSVAAVLMYGLFGLFLFLEAVLKTGFWVSPILLDVLYLVALAALVVEGICWIRQMFRTRKTGIPFFGMDRAPAILARFRQDYRITQLKREYGDDWNTPVWWIYSTRRRVLGWKFVKMMVVLFVPSMTVFAFLISLFSWTHWASPSLTLAFFWVMAVLWWPLVWIIPFDALVKMGHWEGTNGKSNISFPLVVLMEDIG
ncbi:hypothetical protein ACJU26_09100 [Acidithiobacillus sp. M4-SHS-6]|uniref:hypothetical protein n=1 Tax=Acidithiobacillus sp. M4-SHS-6 TaxID=3383024 RepID=UPI0039BDF234